MSCGRLISAVRVVVSIAKGEKYQIIFSFNCCVVILYFIFFRSLILGLELDPEILVLSLFFSNNLSFFAV